MLDKGIFDDKNTQVGANMFEEKISLRNEIHRYM